LPEGRPDLGEFYATQWTRTRLCRLLRDYFKSFRREEFPGKVRVGTDLTFYYDPADRLARVTPDLYVIEGLGYEEQLRSFRVYERGLRPELVLHFVDTAVSPEDGLLMHFLRLGVKDVVLYDPLWWQQQGGGSATTLPPGGWKDRRLLWHYRRVKNPSTGVDSLELQRQEHPGRLFLPRYKLWLIHRGGADLRIYVGDAAAPPPESALWLLPEERDFSQPTMIRS
jgi:hypothetical protein